MKTGRLILAMTALAVLAFAGVVQYLTYHADVVRSGTLVCRSRADYEETVQARAAGDMVWAASVPNCVETDAPHRARAVSCELTVCLVRLWLPSGKAVLAYTSRHDLTVSR